MTDRFPELSETFVAAEIDSLRRAGHYVRVEAGSPGNAPTSDAEARYLVYDHRVRRLAALLRLVYRHPLRVAADIVGRRRWRHAEEVVPLRVLAASACRILDHDATHIHVHFADRAALDAMRIAQILGIPWSLTAHAYDIFMSPRNLTDKMTRAAFVTSGCQYNVDYLRSLVEPVVRHRIHEVVMGVDVQRFRRTRPYRASGTVLAVGRLVEKKGFHYLLEAAAIMKERGQITRTIIVGTGPLDGEFQRMIEELSLNGHVELLGSRTPDEIRDLLEDAEVFVMPCVVARDGDRDSMPVVVKEAMAMEIPVIATDEVGLPELVNSACGVLIQPSNPVALAEAIEGLLSLPLSQRADIGRAGRTRVIAAADVDRETKKLIGLIDAAQSK